jgi:PAS domain S-box-containing protein
MSGKSGLVSGMENEFLQKNDVLRIIFEKIQAGILIIESDTHIIVDANPVAEQLIGLPRDQIIGRECHLFVCPSKKGECPITDKGRDVDRSEKVLLNARGERIPVIKTITKIQVGNKEFLIESFIDLSDRAVAEKRRIELITYMSEAVSRVNKPMEMTIANLQNIVDLTKAGVYDAEDLRMQIQIQTNNLRQMLNNLKEISEKVTKDNEDIPEEFRQYFSGK